jgi:hypothetical protein
MLKPEEPTVAEEKPHPEDDENPPDQSNSEQTETNVENFEETKKTTNAEFQIWDSVKIVKVEKRIVQDQLVSITTTLLGVIVSEVEENFPFVTVVLDLPEKENRDNEKLRVQVRKDSLEKYPNAIRPGAVVTIPPPLGSMLTDGIKGRRKLIVLKKSYMGTKITVGLSNSLSEKIEDNLKQPGECCFRYAHPEY